MSRKTDEPRFRIFNILQYFNHPETGEELWSIEQIEKGLSYKSISDWAYAIHDKDPYTTEEEEADKTGKIKAGELKGKHGHVVLRAKNSPLTLTQISNWFGVPKQFIDIPRGKNAFLDCVEYLTHESDKEQAKGKYLYPDEEIKANFDFRKELLDRAEMRAKYGGDVSERDRILLEVRGGKTLKEVEEENPVFFLNNHKKIADVRNIYLMKKPQPPIRLNMYIDGGGGVGKSITSRAIARALYPNIKDDEDIFFPINGKNVSFEGYDGQPVIIWDDFRAGELLSTLGGRGNVFDLFDPFPQLQKLQNIKYGSINLSNAVNIVNSVDGYEKFLQGLAGEFVDRHGQQHLAEDTIQAYRRFQMIGLVRIESFDILLNKGFFEGSREFDTFYQYSKIKANFSDMTKKIGAGTETLRQAEIKLLNPVFEDAKAKYERAVKGSDAENKIPKNLWEFLKIEDEEEIKELEKEWISYIEVIKLFLEMEEKSLLEILPEDWQNQVNFKKWALQLEKEKIKKDEHWRIVISEVVEEENGPIVEKIVLEIMLDDFELALREINSPFEMKEDFEVEKY